MKMTSKLEHGHKVNTSNMNVKCVLLSCSIDIGLLIKNERCHFDYLVG